ncbi:response regulator [Paenibacillus ginsengarvi]|uniref:Response regulator n=1 Tax=Paenibacillus ginsengarvi TaxID=400777 RepID=A0A3B0BNC2_9BACL|nr:response regulator [Paenibacillus ginsengarvi]RKN74171.1 response regulator [Paenibacillus ginsengarvi]
MRAILADDEELALRYLEKQLLAIGSVEVIGKYADVEEALEAVAANPPDVVFLDIEMPVLSGVEAAELLAQRAPGTDIVFVTAFEEYAVKAFELNAVDYILKPVEKERLARTVARLAERKGHPPIPPASRAVMIRSFQVLEMDLAKTEPIPWRTTKAQELFAYLLHHRAQPVRKDALLEVLWPEVDIKRGYTQLYTTIYQIRKTMESLGADVRIVNYEKGYRLELNDVKIDAEEWEKGVMETKLEPGTLELHLGLLELYRGDYLAEYDYLWAESERQRLKTICFRHVMRLAEWLDSEGKRMEAVSVYYRALRMFPYSEEVHFSLMRQYAKLGDWSSVDKGYAALERMMRDEFDSEVPQPIRSWYREHKRT